LVILRSVQNLGVYDYIINDKESCRCLCDVPWPYIGLLLMTDLNYQRGANKCYMLFDVTLHICHSLLARLFQYGLKKPEASLQCI
jgi:hypothetical protein